MDDLAAALNDVGGPRKQQYAIHRIVALFGDRPEVLDAIKGMHARGFTYAEISEQLSEKSGEEISAFCVSRWLKMEAKRAR